MSYKEYWMLKGKLEATKELAVFFSTPKDFILEHIQYYELMLESWDFEDDCPVLSTAFLTEFHDDNGFRRKSQDWNRELYIEVYEWLKNREE